MPIQDAAEQILATNVGVTLALIARPDGQVDVGLSDRVREAAIAGVVDTPPGSPTGSWPCYESSWTASAPREVSCRGAFELRAQMPQDSSRCPSGASQLRPSPEFNASAGAVMGSTATARRSPSVPG